MSVINYFSENIDFILSNPDKHESWINGIISDHNKSLIELNYIFCNDEYLLDINKEFLDHNTYTDIITFDNSESDQEIEGDIYISIERVKENSITYKIDFEEELKRVMIHGVLHLLGFKDKTTDQKTIMRSKEDECIKLFS